MTTPLPCPFCGGEPTVWKTGEKDMGATIPGHCVLCQGCGCRGGVVLQCDVEGGETTEEAALAAWNRRAEPEEDNESFPHWVQKWKERVRREERERCAEECEDLAGEKPEDPQNNVWDMGWHDGCKNCAAKIRQVYEEVGGE